MQAAASPVYGSSRKLNPGSRQMSLRDFQMDDWASEYSSTTNEVQRIVEEDDVPNLSQDPSSVTNRYSLAISDSLLSPPSVQHPLPL